MKEINGEPTGKEIGKVVPKLRVINGGDHQPDTSTGSCLAFADAARRLSTAMQGKELVVPAFRSPPREVGHRRSLVRHPDGSATVSVMIRNRVWEAVLADMIEGVVVANRLDGVNAEALRDQLWEALTSENSRRESA